MSIITSPNWTGQTGQGWIGQTDQGMQKRFDQHKKKKTEWTDKTHEIRKRDGGHWTPFEASCFEQWYIETQGGNKWLLPFNKINAIRLVTFLKYRNVMRKGKRIHNDLPSGWKPKL